MPLVTPFPSFFSLHTASPVTLPSFGRMLGRLQLCNSFSLVQLHAIPTRLRWIHADVLVLCAAGVVRVMLRGSRAGAH